MTQSAEPTGPGHTVSARPLDARLARHVVRLLKGTRATPNQLTTARLALGLAAAACLAAGSTALANVGAFVFALSNFVDHTDGELARISGASSQFGYVYDRVIAFIGAPAFAVWLSWYFARLRVRRAG